MNPEKWTRTFNEHGDGTRTVSISARVDQDWFDRVKAVALTSRRPMGTVLRLCVEAAVPQMEQELGIRPGQPKKRPGII